MTDVNPVFCRHFFLERYSPGIVECAEDFTAVWKLRKQKLITDGFITLCIHHQHYPCHFYPFILME